MELPLNKIIQGDCLEVLKTFPDKCVDLVLTDPPYGIGVAKQNFLGTKKRKSWIARPTDYGNSDWDNQKPTLEVFNEIIRVSNNQIIFGANYFTDKLPQSDKWMVWDKKNDGTEFSHCELIWTSFGGKKLEIIRFLWRGMFQEDMKHKEYRYHPTQKPVQLFCAILEKHSQPNQIILDPFLGSGTTAIAAKSTHRNYIGIEISPEYCKIAQARIRAAPEPM